MNSNRHKSATPPPRNVYERLSQRLEELSAHDRGLNNAALIRQLRLALFGAIPEEEDEPAIENPAE